MQYSGAHNPLYIISNNNGNSEIKEIKADPMPVGIHFLGDKSFTNHEVQLEIGDTFYIFSDGFIDQIGGENNHRFTSERFKKLLVTIYDQPLYEQKEILEKTLKDWMGAHPQTDDILVIGVRV
jgi:serine phosphatase RsbU (regulator of sigma subunit)